MTAEQFVASIRELGYASPYAIGKSGILGITVRQANRYASGTTAVPEPVAKLIKYLSLMPDRRYRQD